VELKLNSFLNRAQLRTLQELCKGEEGDFFAAKMQALKNTIGTMPDTHGTSGQEDDAIVHLHYFTGSSDWWITERDMEAEQLQAFGFVCRNADWDCAELGYINFEEILSFGAELDLHWEPMALREIKKQHGKVIDD